MAYLVEFWTMERKDEGLMNKTEMRTLRWIEYVMLRDHNINEKVALDRIRYAERPQHK